jgi:propanol-preferring alcohol dehydrogenase
MATMTAYRLLGWGQPPEFVDVPVPVPGADEVLLRVAAVGLCHTDVHLMSQSAEALGYEVPFTLGHETAGHVVETGASITDLPIGAAVVAAAHYWCGRCDYCMRGLDNHCVAHRAGAGYGLDGGLAEYVAVPRNTLVEVGELDLCEAAPLADAGATAYHAVRAVRALLHPGAAVAVIGVGGLGGCALQLLRLVGAGPIIAVDTDERRLRRAIDLGADRTVPSGDDLDTRVREATGPSGAAAVLDFVGTDGSLATAAGLAAPGGAIVIVGAAGGSVPVGWGRVPPDCQVFTCLGNTIADLHDVVALARNSRLAIPHERVMFAEVAEAYDRLRAGDVVGRAVVAMS